MKLDPTEAGKAIEEEVLSLIQSGQVIEVGRQLGEKRSSQLTFGGRIHLSRTAILEQI